MNADKSGETRLFQVKANQGSLILGAIVPLILAAIFFCDWMKSVRRLNPLVDLVIATVCGLVSIFSIGQLIGGPALIVVTPEGLKFRIA